MKNLANQQEVHFYLAADSCDPLLRRISLIRDGLPVRQAVISGVQGAKTIRAFVIALLLAKFRSAEHELGDSWCQLVNSAPRHTWAATLVENFCLDKDPVWWHRARHELGSNGDAIFRLSEVHGRFNISYNADAGRHGGFYAIEGVRLFMGDREVSGIEAQKLALKFEKEEKGWDSLLQLSPAPHQAATTTAVNSKNGLSDWMPLEDKFQLIVGDLDNSLFKPENIHHDLLAGTFIPAQDVATWLGAEHARIQHEQAEQGKIRIWFRPLARLRNYRIVSESIFLTLESTTYIDFAATNLGLLTDSPLALHIRECVGKKLFDLPSPYLANALNVIGMVVTSDGFCLVAHRTDTNFERPGTWQPSVGGSVESTDLTKNDGSMFGIVEALKRETWEELGLKIKDEEVRFLCLGINRRTGAPVLLALIKTAKNKRQVLDGYQKNTLPSKREYLLPEAWKLADLETCCRDLFLCEDKGKVIARDWCSPSDRAIVALTLIREHGREKVSEMLQKSGHTFEEIFL